MTEPQCPLALTREVILDGSIRALVEAADPSLRVLSDEEHRVSMRAALALRPDCGDVWLFAYGSLIWNPTIHFLEKRIGAIRGYHRSFCLWTHAGRGTAAQPGLMLGLERGGSCRGVAYRIAEAQVETELEVIWRREMVTGSYAPRWVKVATDAGAVHALAFAINQEHPRYAGTLPEERVVEAITHASGQLGPCATYLFNTVAHLEALGIHDRRLSRIREQVAAKLAEHAKAAQ